SKNLVYTRSAKAQKPDILICDDDQEVYDTVREFIDKKFAANVEVATNGYEAIAMVKNKKYDLILMDIKMPGINGIDTLKEINKIQPGIKSIIISAWLSDEVTAQTIEAGAIDYLYKPLSPQILKARLKTVLGSIDKLILKEAG
ncbi:MAG TPA: response regulator, partial [Candidatus Bathyarchaeia archaeon]|nr:response regulator [Candidatus Bathyarchaeia archaeon]